MSMDLDDYYYFVARAMNAMLAISEQLGDRGANDRADLPGANSAFALVVHCAGVVDYWVGALLAERTVRRDRLAEFRAHGSLQELRLIVGETLDRLVGDLRTIDIDSTPHEADQSFAGPQRALTTTGVLLHVLEELAQHHGQLEVLRDCLVAGSAR